MAFVVRTADDPYRTVPSIRAAVSRLDASQPIAAVRTMDEHLSRSLARPRFMSTLTAAFGLLALTLAVVGLYGVVAYSVTQRTREIAIRSALGARPADVVAMVLARALSLTLAGVAAGALAAFLTTGLMSGLLYGVSPTDPLTYAAVGVLLFGVALLAGAVPAIRAARINPTRTLNLQS